MRLGIAVAALGILLATVAWAEDATPPAPPLASELDVARIEVLTLKRQVLEDRTARVVAEAQAAYGALARDLDAAIEAAAARAGVDPKVYRLDLPSRTWRKATP